MFHLVCMETRIDELISLPSQYTGVDELASHLQSTISNFISEKLPKYVNIDHVYSNPIVQELIAKFKETGYLLEFLDSLFRKMEIDESIIAQPNDQTPRSIAPDDESVGAKSFTKESIQQKSMGSFKLGFDKGQATLPLLVCSYKKVARINSSNFEDEQKQ